MNRRLFLATLLLIPAVLSFAGRRPEETLHDKTLVAWVAPANLTQRGGSVLTLDDRRGNFDGIVFGEIAPARWMAGSEYYSRTARDQEKLPAETAGPGQFVQVAVVYAGPQVTVYRNGQVISRYAFAGKPLALGPALTVVIGKRHLAQGDPAHFAGEIDDARIYDSALTSEQITVLKPNEATGPKPWAWWTFDTDASDRTGRFAPARLAGGAKVAGGRLLLDGANDTITARPAKEPPVELETPAMPAHLPATWLTYHLAHPGPGIGIPGDPNCAFYWKGRYHLHYIYNSPGQGFAFAHVSSTDLIRWRWHPTTLTPPNTEHGMFSGTGFYTREGRPAIIYHGQGSGRNQIQIAEDDNLEKWAAPMPIEPKLRVGQDPESISHWDPDAWLDGANYYAAFGGHPGSNKAPTLFRSPDLKNWDYLGPFLTHDMPDVAADEDISCPNFFKIGNKWMLLCISHNKGCRYYLGEWKNEKFTPDFHARMNWHERDLFAPESVLTPDGRRVMWAWAFLNEGLPIQSGVQSLPRELSLPKDGVLRIRPLRELQTLRHDEKRLSAFTIADGTPRPLNEIGGDTIELKIVFQPGAARRFGLRIYGDAEGRGGFPILIEPGEKRLTVGETKAPFELGPNEKIELRVFLDKNLIEVFANDRQAVIAAVKTISPSPGLSIVSEGGETRVQELKRWRMRSIYSTPK